jgi:hypothetical protein
MRHPEESSSGPRSIYSRDARSHSSIAEFAARTRDGVEQGSEIVRVTVSHTKSKQEVTRSIDRSFDDIFRSIAMVPAQFVEESGEAGKDQHSLFRFQQNGHTQHAY